jgi:hypothetical protein
VEYQDRVVGEDREKFEEGENAAHAEKPEYVMKEYVVPNRLQLGVFHDDTGNDKKYMHSPLVTDVSANGRHYGICNCFLLQYITQLHPSNRDQLDYIFMMQTSNEKSVARVFSEYVTATCCLPKIFQYLLAACTNKKGKCMLIDNASGSMILHERIFFVQIPWPVPRVLLGSKQFIKYGKKHYLSTRRQNGHKVAERVGFAQQTAPSGIESELSRHLDDDAEEEDGVTWSKIDKNSADKNSTTDKHSTTDRHSVVSLNRKPIHMSTIREGKHIFKDVKGNHVHVQLQRET